MPPKDDSEPDTRLAELSAFVDQCSYNELVHLSETIEPLLKRDFIQQLPLELARQTVSYLSLRDVLSCAQVSQYWNRLASDPLLWHKLCETKHLTKEKNDRDDSASTETDILLSTSSHSTESAVEETLHISEVDWKSVYRRSLEVQCNWRNGTPWAPTVLAAHPNHVITCLEVYGDWAITGSDDSSICVWLLPRGELVINLYGHIGGVWSLTVLTAQSRGSHESQSSSLLISGSCDRTARVWQMDGSRWPCISTLIGHQSTVRCLAVAKLSESIDESLGQLIGTLYPAELRKLPLVVTGSRDTTLRVWNALTGRCLHLLQGHRGAIRCVQISQTKVISGSYDCTLRIWSLLTGQCLRVLFGHTNRVYALLVHDAEIISASLDTTIRVWDMESGRMKHTFAGHQSLTSEMALRGDEGILVSSNADETIRMWRLDTGECVHILAGNHKHQSAVTCVQLTTHFIISSGDDGTVKLWDRLTGKFLRDLIRLDGAGRGGVIWRIVASQSEQRLVCAAGSRNGLESTKLIVLNFQTPQNQHPSRHVCQKRTLPAPSPRLSQVMMMAHLAQSSDSLSENTPSAEYQ